MIRLALMLLAVLAVPALSLAATPQVKMVVKEDGLYRMTYSELKGLGLSLNGLDPRNFSVFHRGVEVAIRVPGEADGQFDTTDRIEFYGTGISRQDPLHQYTDEDVYWLNLEGYSPGLRMTDDTPPASVVTGPVSTAHTLHLEEDTVFATGLPVPEGEDRWLWGGKIQSYDDAGTGARSFVTLPFAAAAVAPGSVTVRARLQGGTDVALVNPDHNTRIYLNGCLVDDAQWDGFEVFTHEGVVPESCLAEGENEFTVQNLPVPDPDNPGSSLEVNSIVLDWFEVVYPRYLVAENNALFFEGPADDAYQYTVSGFTAVSGESVPDIEVFDVTDPANVHPITTVQNVFGYGVFTFTDDAAVSPRRYLALHKKARWQPVALEVDIPSYLSYTGLEADYLFIAHPDLTGQVEPLAALREAQGMSVMVVSTTDIYDEFADGLHTPDAIRAFLSHAYYEWAFAPTYVLLVGDGTFNFKTADGPYGINYVPTHVSRSSDGGAYPDDAWFARVNGDDPVPDMFIGRIPVTPATVDRTVAKIVAYETQANRAWRQHLFFGASWEPGDVQRFEETSEELIAHVPAGYTVERGYIGEPGYGGVVRDNMHQAIEQGTLLTNFSGHGSGVQWADVLYSDDAAGFTNQDRPTFMVGFNCATGNFAEPYGLSTASGMGLGEAFVTAEGGAVGAWMTSWKGYLSHHTVIGNHLFQAFGQEIDNRTGVLLMKAVAGASGEVPASSLYSFNLLGDPAVVLKKGVDADPGGDSPPGGGGGGCAVSPTASHPEDAALLLLLTVLPLFRLARRRPAG